MKRQKCQQIDYSCCSDRDRPCQTTASSRATRLTRLFWITEFQTEAACRFLPLWCRRWRDFRALGRQRKAQTLRCLLLILQTRCLLCQRLTFMIMSEFSIGWTKTLWRLWKCASFWLVCLGPLSSRIQIVCKLRWLRLSLQIFVRVQIAAKPGSVKQGHRDHISWQQSLLQSLSNVSLAWFAALLSNYQSLSIISE